jgi:hypothetical protein
MKRKKSGSATTDLKSFLQFYVVDTQLCAMNLHITTLGCIKKFSL